MRNKENEKRTRRREELWVEGSLPGEGRLDGGTAEVSAPSCGSYKTPTAVQLHPDTTDWIPLLGTWGYNLLEIWVAARRYIPGRP